MSIFAEFAKSLPMHKSSQFSFFFPLKKKKEKKINSILKSLTSIH